VKYCNKLRSVCKLKRETLLFPKSPSDKNKHKLFESYSYPYDTTDCPAGACVVKRAYGQVLLVARIFRSLELQNLSIPNKRVTNIHMILIRKTRKCRHASNRSACLPALVACFRRGVSQAQFTKPVEIKVADFRE
jgi:hypothetical protein